MDAEWSLSVRERGPLMSLDHLHCVAWKVAQACELCAAGTPHHTVGRGAIGDAQRYTSWDLHEVMGPGGAELAECTAFELWVGVMGDVREHYRRVVGGTAM